MKSRYSDVQKISLSAFLLILATLATVIAKMSGIPFLRFCQITFAPAVIMFASLSMGPLYGAIVGGGSDLLGFLLYPTGTLNPFYTILAISYRPATDAFYTTVLGFFCVPACLILFEGILLFFKNFDKNDNIPVIIS